MEAVALVAEHCRRVRDAVQSQKMGIHERHAGAVREPMKGGVQWSLDLSKAFDSVTRVAIWDALVWAQVPEDLANLVLHWHETSSYSLGPRGTDEEQEVIRV